MRKLIKYAIMILLLMSFISCFPKDDSETIGSFLEITVTGNYYNEVTGELTTQEEELRAVVNLYQLEGATKVEGGGYFPSDGGILFSTETGFDISPVNTGTGTAHVNGFIAKGPFEEGATVSIALIDENMNRIEIDQEFISDLEGATDDISEFSINLPATEDVDIEVNLNSLTFLQTERMYWLIENENMSFYEAYLKSKEEVLSLVNIETSIEDFPDFEEMDIREDGDGNAILFLANTLLTAKDSSTKQEDTLLQQVIQQLKENGSILNENISDYLAQRFANLDFETIRQMLINFFQNQGQTVNIPAPTNFLDDDNDLIINRLDISLIQPRGEILVDPNNPTQGSFEWTKVAFPPQMNKTVSYAFELSEHPYFLPQLTYYAEIPQSPPGNQTVVIGNIDPSNFTLGKKYFWRVATIVNGHQKRWAAATSFIPVPVNNPPIGEIKTLNGEFLPTRQVVINNTQINGADTMSFAVNGIPVVVDEDFELFRRIVLPEGNASYTISAQFTNTSGTHTPTSILVNLNQDVPPSGSFNLNGGATETLINGVILDLTGELTVNDPNDGIKYAFMMKFSNESVADLENQPWIPFRSIHIMELAGNIGTNTIYARFANSQGVYDAQASITLVQTQTLNLYVDPGLKIEVGHDFDATTPADPMNVDISKPYFSKTDDQGNIIPHEINIKPGSIIYLTISDSSQYVFNGWSNDTGYTTPSAYTYFIYHYTVGSSDVSMYATSVQAPQWVLTHTLTDHVGVVNSVTFTQDDKIVSGGLDSSIVREFDGTNWIPMHNLSTSGGIINDLAVSLDSAHIVTGLDGGTLSIWDWDGSSSYIETVINNLGYSISSLDIDSNSDKIVVAYDMNLACWEDFGSGWIEYTTPTTNTSIIYSVDISSNDDTGVITGDADNNIIEWEVLTSLVPINTITGHTNEVYDVVYGNVDGNLIVSGGADQTIRIWVYNGNFWMETFTLSGLPAVVNSVDINSIDSEIVAGLSDGSIIVSENTGIDWIIKTILTGHTSVVNSVSYSADDTKIVSGSDDMSVRVWEYTNNY